MTGGGGTSLCLCSLGPFYMVFSFLIFAFFSFLRCKLLLPFRERLFHRVSWGVCPVFGRRFMVAISFYVKFVDGVFSTSLQEESFSQ